MTKISPLLQNHLEANKNSTQAHHSSPIKVNDVKPNLPKAKLIKENILQSAVSSVKDTFQDGKNFFKATKTGKMNDNNLGRINDLGMKAGALAIATFLAAHAKTKTDAIKQFIGGTTFFASMALWPKLFINLPARLVHGFRIDHKYLSAQGDKKDLGLDNQFQPMDIFSDEEMMKMAQRAGIDPKDEFAREKMQRKLQKTMLQNRTLWMATAGFATPLMTSLIMDKIEPSIKNGVIKHGVEKTKNIIGNKEALTEYLNNAKAQVTNAKEIENLFNGMENANLDKGFYQKLAGMMSLNNVFNSFKDPDDIKPILSLESDNAVAVLKQIREDNSVVTKESLLEQVANIQIPVGKKFTKAAQFAPFGKEQASELLAELKNDDKISLTQAKKILQSRFSEKQVEETLKKVRVDNSEFFKQAKDFNAGTLGAIRGRLKAYMDLLNPVVGSKFESAYSADITDTMKTVLDTLGIKDKDYRFMAKSTIEEQQEFLSSKVRQIVSQHQNQAPEKAQAFNKVINEFLSGDKQNADNLNKLKASLTGIFGDNFYLVKDEGQFNNFAKYITADNQIWKDEILRDYARKAVAEAFTFKSGMDVEETVSQLAKSENLETIAGNTQQMLPITKALTGGKLGGQSGLTKWVQNFISNKRVDLASTKFRPLFAANFESRLLSGEFSDLAKEEIEAMRELVYDGTVALRNNNAEIRNSVLHGKLLQRLFNVNPNDYNGSFKMFNMENQIVPGFKQFTKDLYELTNGATETTAKYLKANSFAQTLKNRATTLYENKTWKKIFVPMFLALVGVTLLVQPLFGKIDKEFPKKAKKEGVDNGSK